MCTKRSSGCVGLERAPGGMSEGQSGSRPHEGSADRPAVTELAAQAQELLAAVGIAHGHGVLTAQEQRALMKLIDALANLLGELPENT